jgi:hypothetical protein
MKSQRSQVIKMVFIMGILQICMAQSALAMGGKLPTSKPFSQQVIFKNAQPPTPAHPEDETDDLPESTSKPVIDLDDNLAPQTAPLWEEQRTEGKEWTEIVITGIDKHAPELLTAQPADTNTFCPQFKKMTAGEKKHFWTYFLSAMTKFESNFNPKSSYKENFTDSTGSNVVSRGLMQLSYESAKAYGCPLKNAKDLHDPAVNLECSLKVLGRWVQRDQRIAGHVGGKWQGGARYWAVLRSGKKSYQNIVQLLSKYKDCR